MTISTPRQSEDGAPIKPPTTDDTRTGAVSWSISITPRTLWLALGIMALAVGIGIVVARGIAVLLLIFTAIIIAEGLRPIMNALHTRWHLSQSLAVLLVYSVILLVVGGLAWLLIRALVGQFGTFASALPRLNVQLAHLLGDLQRVLGDSPQVASALKAVEAQAGELVQSALPVLEQAPQLLGGLIFGVVVVAVITFFWLTGIAALRPFVVGLLPTNDRPLANEVLTDISHRLGGYVRGTILNMCVIGVLSTLGDWLLGTPFPLLLGLVAGGAQILPYFGPWISSAVVILVVLPLAGPLKVVEVIGFYAILQTIEGNTLAPIIMMDTVDMNPLLVIVAVLLGAALLGVPGAILGVPAVSILQVVVVRVLAPIARRASAHQRRPAQRLLPLHETPSPERQ